MVFIPEYYRDKLPEVDISNVQGNACDETKRFVWSIFKFFLGSSEWFSNAIGQSVQCVKVDVEGMGTEKGPTKGKTVFEVTVTPSESLRSAL